MSNPEVQIEFTGDNYDFAKLAQQIDAASWDEDNEIEAGQYTAESLKAFVTAPRTFLTVAFIGGEFAGMASGSMMLHPHKTGNWLYVDELDVTTDRRRQGTGKALMEFLETYAKQLGCYELALGADTPNVAANKLYESRKPSEIEPANWYCYKLKDT